MFILKKKCSDEAKKIRRLSKEEIKQQLIDSLIKSDKIETEELNEKVDIKLRNLSMPPTL